MKHRLVRRLGSPGRMALFVPLSTALLVHGCSDEKPTEAPGCTATTCDDEELVGVPLHPVCLDAFCTQDVDCAAVLEVSSDDELASATASADSGECIALAPGSYGDVELAPGVSLLGRFADEVTVGAIVVGAGKTTIRGLTADRIESTGLESLAIEQARIVGGAIGLSATGGGELSLVRSEVTGATDYGLFADGLASLRVQRAYVHDTDGAAVWAQCMAEPECSAPSKVEIDDVVVERARHAGVQLLGVDATLRSLSIAETRQRPGLAGGVGLTIASGSAIDAQDVTIDGADSAGVLVADSQGNLGAPGSESGIIIINGRFGVWLSGDNDLTLEGFEIDGAQGVGVGIDADAKGIIIINGRVANTLLADLPVQGGGVQPVGDGFLWKTGASASVTGVSIDNSARAAFLIDGPVGSASTIDDLELLGGDADFGIVQQGVQDGETAPTTGMGTPAVAQQADAPFAVPASLSSPGAI